MNIRNNNEPKTESCGTPWVISLGIQLGPLILICCFLFIRDDFSQLLAVPLIP